MTITKGETSYDRIRIYWKQVKDKVGNLLPVEVKYNYEEEEDWHIKMMMPGQVSFEAVDLPSFAPIHFELRSLGRDGSFGPVTKKTFKTKRK